MAGSGRPHDRLPGRSPQKRRRPRPDNRLLPTYRNSPCVVAAMFRRIAPYALGSRLTLNHAAYSAGRNRSVSKVATHKPPMIATAIGPQKIERDKGIIARIAASAVSMIGRKRRTAEPII